MPELSEHKSVNTWAEAVLKVTIASELISKFDMLILENVEAIGKKSALSCLKDSTQIAIDEMERRWEHY